MATNDKLTPAEKPANGTGLNIQMTPPVIRPQVKVGAPVVNLKMDAPQVNMDTAEFALALTNLAQMVAQVSQTQQAILQAMGKHDQRLVEVSQQHQALLKQIISADNKPVVKFPPRPRSFEVDIEGDDGEMTRMRIRANSSN